jgi:hypothetical protein
MAGALESLIRTGLLSHDLSCSVVCVLWLGQSNALLSTALGKHSVLMAELLKNFTQRC